MTDGDASAAALVGATGGAGTTRLTVELAATLARDGREVAVLDAAFATQGLSAYLDGRLDPDLTALVTDRVDDPLSAGLVEWGLDVEGRVACCPAAAPFERIARAKTPTAAQEFEARIDEAGGAFDHVLVDTPPVAANQSVAAVNACERVAVVAPATTRGRDAVQRATGRLDDVGVDHDAVVTTRGDLEVATASVPETAATATAAPTCLAEGTMATAVAEVAEAVVDVDITVEEGSLLDSVGKFVSR
jgi:septum site-determining protein MinD